MKQYNRIMLGEHGKYTKDCLEGNYIGANFLKNHDLTDSPFHSEKEWRQMYVQQNLKDYPDKSIGTARTSIGFLWTICFGLKIGDIILAPNGEGCYNVGEITGNYFYVPNSNLPHRRPVTWLNTLIPRQRMSKNLQHSTGSIGTCCNITKYKDELENLIQGTPQNDLIRNEAYTDYFRIGYQGIIFCQRPSSTKNPRKIKHKSGYILI